MELEWGFVTLGAVLLAGGVWLLQRQNVSQDLANDPYYRLESIADIKAAAAAGLKIDVNQASIDDWLRLPGISIHQARTLTELTQIGVQFHCLDDVAAALNLPLQRLQPLEPVLMFCYYELGSMITIQPMNPNTATAQMLMKIPGVDSYLARAIVENRVQGHYRNLTHLQRRLSLPSELTAQLMHYLKF